MASYSKEFKEKMIIRMLPPNSEPVSKISKETKISVATLHNWKKSFTTSDQSSISRKKTNVKWSSQDKFLIVMETASMNEIELSNYCRSKGLYVEQLKEWKSVCMQANGGVAEEASRLNKEMKVKDKEIKSLEKELWRKEKALAETAAILVLRKKLNTLLGTDDEEE
jgi:transposase-like protein